MKTYKVILESGEGKVQGTVTEANSKKAVKKVINDANVYYPDQYTKKFSFRHLVSCTEII